MKKNIERIILSENFVVTVLATALAYCIVAKDYTTLDFKAIVVCLIVFGLNKIVSKIYNKLME